ncbi:hypothetical protein G6F35_017794 [Rhizopus arrhizus]|nr:hypothetical protein G6F35_017794 [Rhizopus arrhizus]KAG1389872.1 hypothetical protein G6F58_013164 [Rhizopus delemar]
MDGSSPWLSSTPWLALVRLPGHAGLSPVAAVRVVVLLRRLRTACLRHWRRDCRRQRPCRRAGCHRHVDLALAPITPRHHLRLGPLGERGGHSQGGSNAASRRVPRPA